MDAYKFVWCRDKIAVFVKVKFDCFLNPLFQFSQVIRLGMAAGKRGYRSNVFAIFVLFDYN
ncbi:glutathione peroxidase [Moorella thermoacetica Y72]|uniref:Glutathione peroxidase n=1 Tax=Moorella thermoacetica Y72 TaxID=1325331 RepID=A0A0S6UCJ4_NEOTH|nr:glutathione peroxidase [Moorella thermoacetica Y72]